LMDLISDIRKPILGAAGSSLDDETIAILGQRSVTARDLRIGLDLRLHELRTKSESEELAELSERLEQENRKLREIDRAKRLLTSANRAANKLRDTETKIDEILRTLNAGGEEEYQVVTRRLQDLEEQRIALIEKRVVLQLNKQLLESEGGSHFLAQRISAIVGNLAFDLPPDIDLADMLADRLRERIEHEQVARESLQRADEQLGELRRQVAEYELRIAQAVALLQSSSDYGWLRQAVEHFLPTENSSTQRAIAQLEKIRVVTQGFSASLDEMINVSGALAEAMNDLADGLVGRRPVGNPIVRALAAHYEQEFGELLSDEDIQLALFGDGRFEALDLLRGEVSWADRAGDLHLRPLEAFSSGELAFAFVLVSILQGTNYTAEHRVLVLDEFGAFIESDRLQRLTRFLRERVLKSELAKQVVIVLPLREPIQVDGVKPRIALEKEVDERGYFCQGISL
jgi:hypothetical protein